MYVKREFYNESFNNFGLALIDNSYTLNIFSDASMRRRGEVLDGCYGAVAVCKDRILDECIRINSGCTVPAAEIRGLRTSLSLALAHRYEFPNINLFSDSQIAVFGLREYIYKWHYDPSTHSFYTKKHIRDDNLAKNQQLYVECLEMLTDLSQTNRVNLFHQKGHVENQRDLLHAIETFKEANKITGKIDYNLIRYISVYNNYIDDKTRSILMRTNVYNNNYIDPISFFPVKFGKIKFI